MSPSDSGEHPEFMDAANVGLVDSVCSGWFGEGKLYDGFPVGPGDRVADIGCGPGWAGPHCANLGAEVALVDVLENSVRALESKLADHRERVRGYVADGAALPFENSSFNRVVCTEVLEHVPDPQAVMRELFRIAEPGALVLLSAPHPASEKLMAAVAPPSYFRPPNHIRTIAPDELKALATDVGLELCSYGVNGFFWSVGLAALCAIRASERGPEADLDITPPYPDFLSRWARVWQDMLDQPALAPARAALNEALPRTQVLLARKPMTDGAA